MDSSTSDNAWTSVGKGGRPISFPPAAAAAFGGGGGGGKYRSTAPQSIGRAEFPADAAAAFGRKGRTVPRHSEPFDSAAASAFGKPRAATTNAATATASSTEYNDDAASAFGSKRHSGFDAAAAAAFGSKESPRRAPSGRGATHDFPDAFGKKKSAFASAAELGLGDDADEPFKLSAFARKRAAAGTNTVEKAPEPKKQTYEEMFPTLGGPSKAAPVARPAASTSTSAKPTLAELMRRRVAEEEAEEARKAALEKERAEKARVDAAERARLRGLRGARMDNYISYNDEEEEEEVYVPGDLDYDAYGTKRDELTMPDRLQEESDGSSEDGDEDAEATDY